MGLRQRVDVQSRPRGKAGWRSGRGGQGWPCAPEQAQPRAGKRLWGAVPGGCWVRLSRHPAPAQSYNQLLSIRKGSLPHDKKPAVDHPELRFDLDDTAGRRQQTSEEGSMRGRASPGNSCELQPCSKLTQEDAAAEPAAARGPHRLPRPRSSARPSRGHAPHTASVDSSNLACGGGATCLASANEVRVEMPLR